MKTVAFLFSLLLCSATIVFGMKRDANQHRTDDHVEDLLDPNADIDWTNADQVYAFNEAMAKHHEFMMAARAKAKAAACKKALVYKKEKSSF